MDTTGPVPAELRGHCFLCEPLVSTDVVGAMLPTGGWLVAGVDVGPELLWTWGLCGGATATALHRVIGEWDSGHGQTPLT